MILTDEQVTHWRNVLVLTIGAYALVMPREDLVKVANSFQEAANGQTEN